MGNQLRIASEKGTTQTIGAIEGVRPASARS
jgi:hypothetical protein